MGKELTISEMWEMGIVGKRVKLEGKKKERNECGNGDGSEGL